MENKTTFGPIVLFGLGTGAIMVIFSLLMYLLGVEQKSLMNLVAYLFLIGGMFWGMTSIRENRLNGVMSYGKAFGTGFWIGFIAAILLAVYSYFYLTYLNPHALQQALTEAENKILESNPDISDENLDKALAMVKMFGKPIISALMQIVSNSFFSVVFALIIAIFAKRVDKTIS